MILMGLVSLALFVGMPKLVENSTFLSSRALMSYRLLLRGLFTNIMPLYLTVDPETRAEFEEQSKKNPMNSLMGGPQPGSNPMGNFDVAGFLAGQGSSSKEESAETSSKNGGKKGGKK